FPPDRTASRRPPCSYADCRRTTRNARGETSPPHRRLGHNPWHCAGCAGDWRPPLASSCWAAASWPKRAGQSQVEVVLVVILCLQPAAAVVWLVAAVVPVRAMATHLAWVVRAVPAPR